MSIKKYLVGTVLGVCLTATSCDVLDIDPTGNFNETTAFSSIKNLDLYVEGLYENSLYMNSDISYSYVMDDGISDLVKYSYYVDKGQVNRMFYEDNMISPIGDFRSRWGLYDGIRRMNEYFHDVNAGFAAALPQDELAIRTAEVRFMRALLYQELTLRYGGVILRVDEQKVDGPTENDKARASEQECWDFVIGEYKTAAETLPEKWDSNRYGRVTKGAAYGMIARAALYAERWDVAQTYASKVIDEMGLYQLQPGLTYADYYKIFTNPVNSELIIPVLFAEGTHGKMHSFNTWNCPPYDGQLQVSKAKVGALATPSDEYASTFDIKVGDKWEAFDWKNLKKYGNEPFANREPRFYASILYTGADWKGRKLQIYKGGTDGFMEFSPAIPANFCMSTTGYLFRKFVSDSPNINFSSINSGQYWIEMRLAELYLIRSEAYARQNKFNEAYADLKTIRNRVGLPELPQTGNWEAYLKDLAKERICELGLEGHRYFDLIRWGKTQEVLNNSRLHGVKVTPKNGGFTYERIVVDTQDRHYPEKYNVYPIPQTEIQNNPLCVQSEVWN